MRQRFPKTIREDQPISKRSPVQNMTAADTFKTTAALDVVKIPNSADSKDPRHKSMYCSEPQILENESQKPRVLVPMLSLKPRYAHCRSSKTVTIFFQKAPFTASTLEHPFML